MVNQLLTTLKQDKPILAPVRVWQAYAQLDEVQGKQPLNELTALVALVRRACGIDGKIDTFGDTVSRNFKTLDFQTPSGQRPKFSEQQMQWLQMIRDHIAGSFHLNGMTWSSRPLIIRVGWVVCISCSGMRWMV